VGGRGQSAKDADAAPSRVLAVGPCPLVETNRPGAEPHMADGCFTRRAHHVKHPFTV